MPLGPYNGPDESTANGATTVFPYTFKIFDEDHLAVYLDDVLQVSGYTVSGVGDDNGGNVTFAVAPTADAVVKRASAVPYIREIDYQRNGAFDEETVDDDQDIQERQIQQLAVQVADILEEIEEIRQLIEDLIELIENLGGGGGIGDTITLNNLTINDLLTVLGDAIFEGDVIFTGTVDLPDGSVHIEHLGDDVLNLILSITGGGGGGGGGIASGDGRLTFLTGTPIMPNDVTGKTSFFYAGSFILMLNDGTGLFEPELIDELSNALSSTDRSPAATVANKVYDAFGWAGDSQSVTTITRSDTTATVTKIAHGYNIGECVVITGATQTQYNGPHLITGKTDDTFTFEVTGTPASPATGTITMRGVFLSRGPAWRNGGQVITGATNATPIVITAVAHGLQNGDDVEVAGVQGNTAANGSWVVANKTDDTFELVDSDGNGTYTAGTGNFSSRGNGAGTAGIEQLGNTYVNKVAITNGPAAQMGTYLGTIMTNGSNQLDWKLGTNATGGGEAWLGVWNVSNPSETGAAVQDATATWTKTTDTTEALNLSNTWRATMVRGLNNTLVKASIHSQVFPPSTGSAAGVAIGLNSTGIAAPRANVVSAANGNATTAGNFPISSEWQGFPGSGRTFIQALQAADLASGTATLYGTNSGLAQSTMYVTSQQ